MGRDLLAGRTALVTGGSGGIGRALALQLAAEGRAVALGFRTSRESAEQLAAEIAEQGRPVVAIEADLSKPEAPVELAEAVEFALGPIDILVANAGVGRVASYQDVDGALFDETLATNLRAPYLLARHVLPGMRQRGLVASSSSRPSPASSGGLSAPTTRLLRQRCTGSRTTSRHASRR